MNSLRRPFAMPLSPWPLLTLLWLPLALGATGLEKRIEIDADPARGWIEGSLEVGLPPGEHRFRLGEEMELLGAHSERGRPRLGRDKDGVHRLRVPRNSGMTTLRWQGTLAARDPMRSRAFLTDSGGFLPSSAGWYPRFEPMDDFQATVAVRVPPGQRAVATGSLVAGPQDTAQGYRAVYEHPRTDSLTLATGPWLERTLDSDGVTIRTLFPRSLDSEHAEEYLRHSAEYLRLFAARAGAYPYRSFTIAASPMPVGFAFPGFTLLGERVIPLPFIPRTSLAHELMHNWWGTGVRVDYATGNWSEGLTTFMADYHLDELRGQGQQARHRWLLDLAAVPPELDRPLGDFLGGNQGVDRIVGYNKGVLLFEMLRERIGAQPFDEAVRLVRDRHLFEAAGWTDLERAFSEVSGDDLGAFFEAWVRRGGLPELTLHSVSQQPEDGAWIVTGMIEQTQASDPWPLRVPVQALLAPPEGDGVDAAAEAGMDQQWVVLEGRRGEFRLQLPRPAFTIVADPAHQTLRRLADPPPILRTVTLHPDTRLVALTPGLDRLATRLLGRVPQGADGLDDNTPLLLMGGTGEVIEWLREAGGPEPPAAVARAGHARMYTLPGSRIAVVSADDDAGLAQLAAMLRHHGHRSFMVQDASGSTVESGVWDTTEHALRADLPTP